MGRIGVGDRRRACATRPYEYDSFGAGEWRFRLAEALDRMAAISAGSPVREDQAASNVDSEPDSDFDPEERKS